MTRLLTRLLRLSKLFQDVIDHRGAEWPAGGGMVGTLGFRYGPYLPLYTLYAEFVKNNMRTTLPAAQTSTRAPSSMTRPAGSLK